MTIRARYDNAVSDLAAQNITAVIDTAALSSGDAWCDHTKTNSRAAVAHEYGAFWHDGDTLRWHEGSRGGQVRSLHFAHPRSDLTVAKAVVDAFTAHGFVVDWDGTPEHAIIVTLAA